MGYAARILVVDDDPDVQTFICRVLSEAGYQVTAAPTARRALAEARDRSFDVVIIDLSLPDGDGLEVIQQIHSESPPPKILAISGYMVGDVRNAALSNGATATLSKPTPLRQLLDIVCLLLHMSNTSSTGT